MYLTMFANGGEYISEKLKMPIAKQKKSDTTLVSYTLTLSIRYGNKEEILKFLLVPNLPLSSLQ